MILASDSLPSFLLDRAAEAIINADALLVCAGAGMGVDSGLPDFRGGEGFWRAYPPLARLGLLFEDMATEEWFYRDPALAWGFYGHRLNLYRRTIPHDGFSFLLRWAETKPAGSFVYTSNVDGQFQKAGFNENEVVECHGSIHHLQCVAGCSRDIWSADDVSVEVDEETLRAKVPVPACSHCGFVARPNLLLFNDWKWLATRSGAQEKRMGLWLRSIKKRALRLTIVECGAGRAIPTVRSFSDRLSASGATFIRINPREPQTRPGSISLAAGALETLQALDARIPTAKGFSTG